VAEPLAAGPPADAVTYQLVIHLPRPCRIAPGRLGEFALAPGWYLYTGSARRNMVARVRRHLRRDKPLRWHIDWLLERTPAEVAAVRYSADTECAVNARGGGTIPVPGFGASDCRAACGSHLRYLGAAGGV